jgi:hypothetical protein
MRPTLSLCCTFDISASKQPQATLVVVECHDGYPRLFWFATAHAHRVLISACAASTDKQTNIRCIETSTSNDAVDAGLKEPPVMLGLWCQCPADIHTVSRFQVW